jgi:hypothetical protein
VFIPKEELGGGNKKRSSSLQWRGRLKILFKCAPIPKDRQV